jgi:hypothetical protein
MEIPYYDAVCTIKSSHLACELEPGAEYYMEETEAIAHDYSGDCGHGNRYLGYNECRSCPTITAWILKRK